VGSKADFNVSLGLIAKRLRDDGEKIAHEAVPNRWADLIRCLDAQERRSLEHGHGSAEPISLAAAELAVHNQAKVLQELIRTDEPTQEAVVLLDELRRKVARAVAEREQQ